MKPISYGKQTILQEDIDAVVEVLKSDFMTQGPKIAEFEKVVAEYHGAKYAVAFSNGTAALHAAYASLGIAVGDEIITSPITFAATANGAVYCGATPKFVDIDPQTNCIDINKIEDGITDKTKVISPVAYAGYPVDLKSIKEIADKHNCAVLYDAAHAIASRRDGSFGMEYVDVAILSFHPVKHIATGEGGMVLTNDSSIYEKLNLFRSHGITKNPDLLEKNDGPWYYEMQSVGYNYRITDIQCALGLSQFGRIDDNIKRRNEIAKIYGEELGGLVFLTIPPSVGFDIIDQSDAQDVHSYHLYTVKTSDSDERKKLFAYLHDNNILVQVHYVPVHLHPYYRNNFGYKYGDFPVAENFYEREISLPMFHGMQQEQLEYIIDTLKRY